MSEFDLRTRPSPTTCPHCDQCHDFATNVSSNRQAPDPGSVSICVGCGKLAVFAEANHLRLPTEAEAQLFAADPDLRRALRVLRELKAKRPS